MKRLTRFLNSEIGMAYTVLIPTSILIFFMAYFPAIQSFKFSLMYYNTRMPWKIRFVGLKNYLEILKYPEFWESLGRSAYFVLMSVIIIIPMAVGIALLLNTDFKGRGIIRTLVILPWAIPPVVNGFMWRWILNGDYGFLNGILYQLGLINSYKPWLMEPFAALNWAVLTFVWRFTPFSVILILGALQSIPEDVYDASRVDGADALVRFFRITLPLIRPVLTIVLIVVMIYSFTVFDEIYALTGLDPATKTLMMYDYELAFEKGRLGLGSALAYTIGIFMFAMAYAYIKALYREVEM